MQMKISTFAIAFVACVFFAQPIPGQAQTNKPTAPAKTTPAEINSYTAEIDRFIKKNPKARIFGDVSSAYTDRTSRWREFKSEAEQEKATTGENMNQAAFVWSREEKIVGATLRLRVHRVIGRTSSCTTSAKMDPSRKSKLN